jgi:DNA-binding Xre family transcriptional regulator
MPVYIDIEPALLQWQAKHSQRMTYEELAQRAEITIAALYRIKSRRMITPDLRKINAICKVLECEPGDLFRRDETSPFDDNAELEAQRQSVLHEFYDHRSPKTGKTS